MEIKSVYMDLVEGVKKGKVWKLESEAFKKPIELKIGYENTELQQFNTKISDIHKILEQKELVIKNLQTKLGDLENKQEHLLEWYLNSLKLVGELKEKNEEQDKLINEIAKKLKNSENTAEQQSGTILHLKDRINEIEKKITKVPTIYSDKMFVSWHEMVWEWPIQIPNGEYIVISKFTVGEHNEYVENEDEIRWEKVNVEDNYFVTYELVGWTDLDTPTAEIHYSLLFIPC